MKRRKESFYLHFSQKPDMNFDVDHEHHCHPFSLFSLPITPHYTVHVHHKSTACFCWCMGSVGANSIIVFEPIQIHVNILHIFVCYSKVPLALTYDARHKVTCMDIDEQKKKLLTVGSDKIIKVSYILVGVHK